MHFSQTIKANGFSLLRGQGLPQIIIFANYLFEKIFCNKKIDTKEPNKLGLFW